MTIRQIHDFGPAVGEYVCGADTDIRETMDRERARLVVSTLPPRQGATTARLCHSFCLEAFNG